ncbi:hypothetical protein AAC387_Pa03g4151 [Persea americana]
MTNASSSTKMLPENLVALEKEIEEVKSMFTELMKLLKMKVKKVDTIVRNLFFNGDWLSSFDPTRRVVAANVAERSRPCDQLRGYEAKTEWGKEVEARRGQQRRRGRRVRENLPVLGNSWERRNKNSVSFEHLGKNDYKLANGFVYVDELQGMEVAWNQAKLNDVFLSPEELESLYSKVHLLSTVNHDSIIHFCASWIDVEKRTINFITEMFTSGTLREYRRRYKRVNI